VSDESVERVLGRLEGGVDSLKNMLEAHTQADSDNFARLEAHLLRLGAAVTTPPPKNTARAAAWGTGAATFVVTVFEALRRLAG
jgi:hypothetical protein